MDAITAIAAWCVSLALLIVCAATRPQRGECPPGWYVEGVRVMSLGIEPIGSFACKRPAVGGETDVLTGKSTAHELPGELRGRIYCTGGALPIVVNERAVGCQR